MIPVLLDTGVIVAFLDRREQHHARCANLIRNLDRPLATCEEVITESCYLLAGVVGASEAVIENVEKKIFEIPFQLSRSAAAVRSILRKYRDIPASMADACLIHLADELDTGDILTLDRDFELYRWRRNCPFNLLVDLD